LEIRHRVRQHLGTYYIHSSSIRKDRASASEMTYIVSGGALNSTNSTQGQSKDKRLFPPKPCLHIGQRGPLNSAHLAPHPPVTQTRTPRPRGRRGEERATCQSISDCSPTPKTTDDRVTVARPSDGPTDPSRRSRGADPALERETNKIIKDDRRARRARLRTPRRLAPTPATDVSRRRSTPRVRLCPIR